MAKSPEIKRAYRFSDGTLIQLHDDVSASVTRDLTDLATYGVLAATVTAMTALRTAFYAVPGDALKLGAIIIATEAKNAAREALLTETRSLELRVQNKVGADSGKARSLGLTDISRQTDRDLIISANNAHQATTLILADLTGTGIDATYLTAYRTKVTALDTAIDAIREAVKDRDLTTQDRITKGNTLYAEIVRLASFGKDKYYTTNEAKYNDYVLIENAEAIGNTRTLALANNEKKNVTFEGIEATDIFTLTADPAKDTQVYFSDTLTGDPVGTPYLLLTGTEVTKTATELGWETLKPFMVLRNNAQGQNIEVTVVREG